MLTESVGWESIFFINVPIGLAAIVVSLRKVRETRDPSPRAIDWAGLVTFSVALFLLIFALVRGNAEGWGSPLITGFLVGAAVLLVAFVVNERRIAEPMLDLRLFAQPLVHRRLARRLRDLGVDVLGLPLPHALPPERAGLLAAGGGPALPPALGPVLLRGADRRAADVAPARPRASSAGAWS